jgi:hypothetical protein
MAQCRPSLENNCLLFRAVTTWRLVLQRVLVKRSRQQFLQGGKSCSLSCVDAPIIGFINREYAKELITVEVKEKTLTIEDIYQAKMYKELFSARYGFLVTASPIPEALKRLCKQTPSILHSVDDGIFKFLTIAQIDRAGGFIEWFEDNPFVKEFYWK